MVLNIIAGVKAMQVNSYATMYQYQMKNMNGSEADTRKQSGLGDIMQNLSQEQRIGLREQMSLLDQSDRKNVIEEMSQIDSTTMSQDEYYKMLIDIVNRQVPPTATIQSLFYMYA